VNAPEKLKIRLQNDKLFMATAFQTTWRMKRMKKDKALIATIACLMVIFLSTFALLHMQVAESIKIQKEKKDIDASGVTNDAANQQTFDSNIKQTPSFDVTKNNHEFNDQCRQQDEQTPSQNESAMKPTQANQDRVSQPPVPFPDGRIFSHAIGGTEDAIPYIPTEYPKTAITTPLVPLELDS